MSSSTNSHDYLAVAYNDDDRCVKCRTTGHLHEYKGDLHCESCLNERIIKE